MPIELGIPGMPGVSGEPNELGTSGLGNVQINIVNDEASVYFYNNIIYSEEYSNSPGEDLYLDRKGMFYDYNNIYFDMYRDLNRAWTESNNIIGSDLLENEDCSIAN